MLHELVEVMVTEDVRSPIAHDHVDFFASEDLLDFFNRLLSCDVTLDRDNSFDRRNLKNVNTNQMRLSCHIDAFFRKLARNDLGPGARGCTQVYYALHLAENVKTTVNLKEFVGGTCPVAFLFGFPVVNVASVFSCLAHISLNIY